MLRRVTSVNEDGIERTLEEDEARDRDERPFGPREKRMLERELLMGVVIGVARLPEGMEIHEQEDQHGMGMGEDEAAGAGWGEVWVDEGRAEMGGSPEQTEGEYWGAGPSVEEDMRRQEEALQHHSIAGPSSLKWVSPVDKPSAAENRRQEENPDSAENKDSEPCHEDDESAYLEATTVPLPPAEEPPSISITTSPLTELDNDRNPTFNITSPRTPPNERSMSPVIIPPTPPSPPSGPPSRLFIPSTPPSLVARSPLPPTAEPPTSPTLPNVSLPGRGTPIAIPVTPAPMTSTPISALALGPRSAIPSRMLEGIFSPMSASSSGSGGGLLGHGGSSRSSLGGLMGLPSPSWMMSPSASPPNSRRMSELRISMEDESSDMSTERVGLGFLPRTPPRQEHGVLLAVGDEDEDEDEDEVEAWGPLSASPTKVKRRRPSLSPVQPSTIASSPSSSSQPLLLGPSALPSTPILQERRTLAEALLQPTASSSGSSSSSGDPSDDPSPSGSGTQVGHHSRTVTPGESPRSTSDEGSSASFRETPLDEEEEEEGHAGRPGPLSLSDLSPAIEESETSPEPFSLVDLSPTGVGEPPPGMSGPVIVGEAVPMRPSDIAFPPSASFTSVSMFMPHPPASSPATSSSDNTTASGRTLLSATSTETPPSAVSSDVIRTPEDGEDAEDNGGNSVGLGSPEQSLQEGWINPYFSSALVHDADDDDGAGADDFDVHGGGRPPFSRKNTQSSNNESSNGSSSGNTATGPERESSDQEYTPENEQERERSDGSGEAKATSPPPAPATSSPSVDVGRNEASGPVAVEQERQLHTMIPTSPVPQESMEQARRAMVVAEEEKRDVLDSRHPPPASFAIPSTSRPMTGMDPSEALPPLRAEPSFNPPAPSSPHYIAPLTSPTGEVPPPTIFQRRRSSANAGMLGLPPALAPSSPTNPIRAGDSPYPSPPEYGSPIVAWDPSSRLVGSPPPRPSAVHLSSGGTLYHPIPATQFDFPTPVHGSSNPTPVGEITPPLDLNPHHDHPEPFLTDVADDPTLWQHHEGDTPDDGLEGAGEDAAVGRVASMSLIAAVTAAGVVSQDTKRIFAEEVVRVGRDHVYWVRREAAYALGALAKVVSQEVLIDAMLPLYEDMTADEIWHVRQSALFALPGILVRLTPVRRRELALAQCRLLAHDTAKSVRAALLEVMGEVIYSFRDDEGGPPDDLVDLFIGKNEQHEDATWTEPPDSGTRMWGLITPFKNDPTPVTPGGSDPPLRSLFESNVDPSRFDPSHFRSDSSPIMAITNGAYKRDPERVLICAFNFPAVVASMGASRWVELRSHYIGLTQHTAVKVRRTLAASIGEIARIIGEAHAHRDLTGVWWELVHDDTADVREKIIGCLDMYVAALPADDRRNVAVQLGGLWDGTLVGWREREALAAQLGSLSELLSPVGRADSVRAMMWKALTAAVAAVREAAVSSSPKYFEFLPEEVALAAKDDLFTLAASRSFRQRVTFVAVCQARVIARTLLSDGCQETDYLQVFEALSHDPVVDVRIGLSRLISLLSEQSYLDPATRPAPITALIRTFAADPSPQVKSFVAFVASSPTVPLSAFSATSSPSISTHHFGLFSRPPTRATLLTDSLEDLMHADTSDMDSDSESGSAIPVGSGSTRATAGVPSMTTAVALTTNYDDNPFLHDPDLHVS
ncbi:hypothetical protein FRB95_006007 [Tulasnella sp. JGI-2019a]|nr:hypothetical protein FRB95_006007 [Tulasnella sp. JGI-2019a]